MRGIEPREHDCDIDGCGGDDCLDALELARIDHLTEQADTERKERDR